ncbi:MAG: DNA polymerase III subunit gamma/tau [Clostridia bacterium]|nr:DNA polymerase III subunit gamma/tau [Clostridia bacterium]
MSYQAIYRKWRPLVFEDIVGQTHITRTLKNQILTGKIAHAYLFCGTRGTGKTTAAKVFSRAVNCLNNTTGSPCNECDICRGILSGSILDVSEIDAASNNGVENIREIRDEVAYSAAQTKYRVYIIDEVHMLSTGAFNALLKTLEEPPEHVIFILATTEAHKLPQTILSRCQRFDFKRIPASDIIVRMKEIAAGDGLVISEDAYALLAKLADGSMRDGLSILERCISSCGNNLTAERIISVLGISPAETTFEVADAIINKDASKAVSIIDALMSDGRDLHTFIDSLIEHFRNLLVCKISSQPEQILDVSAEALVKLKTQCEKITFEKISNATTLLSQTKADAKWVKSPRIIYELGLIKLCRPELDSSADALLDRVSELEEKLKNGVPLNESVVEKKEEKISHSEKKKKVSERIFKPIDKKSLTADSPIVTAAKKWDKMVQAIGKSAPHLIGPLSGKSVTIDGEGIIILFEQTEKMSKHIADTYINVIEDKAVKTSGINLRVKTAFRTDIEDYIIDFWDIKAEDESVYLEEQAQEHIDPLDKLAEDFPEIVEFTDDSDFINYEDEHFEQSSIEEIYYENEEFLDD